MRNRAPKLVCIAAALAAATASCTDGAAPPAPGLSARAEAVSSLPPVRVSEFHYDNASTDVGEAIELSGPAGTDLAGWKVVLYDGGGGKAYNTQTFSVATPIPATCGARGVIVLNYPTNGIQNGSPDGIALVDPQSVVVEFISYEGTFTALDGPAAGLASTDIGVREAGTEAPGMSLQLDANGVWSGPIANTFGACNDGDQAPPPPPDVASVTVAPTSATVAPGVKQTFTATALDAGGQPIGGVTFTWSTDLSAVATITANGVATGVAQGDAVVTATAPNGVAGTAALHVTAPPPPPPFPDIRFTELHYDNTGTDVGEAIEIEGPVGASVAGWTVVLYDGNGGGPYNTQTLAGSIPAGTCVDRPDRGVLVLNYPTNGIQNGSPDGMALIDGNGAVVEFLSYEGTMLATSGPAVGLTSTDIIAQEASSAPLGTSLQRDLSNRWASGASTFGACNAAGPPPPLGNTISFSGRTPSDPPLPVGFQDQLFATVRDPSNVVVPTTIAWSSDTPAVASIDATTGVMTAITEGTAIFRATAGDGTTATWSLPTRVAVASTTASYIGNAEFGEPTDSDPSDDFIVRHAEYTASYNPNRGTPNWVSYDLDPTDFGPEDRCDCFTFDPDLPPEFPRYTTADYTGAAAINGFGIDRGHMTRSFDRTSASLDNAHTFLFTNVVPQASDLNQGPWANLENELGDLVRFQGKEVYIIAGVAGDQGTLKNEGKVVIPASTWKVAVIMQHDQGLADIRDYRDLQVIAVNMPNQAGVRNVDWHTYETTVDAIEALTGYDLLALLPDKIENIVEAGIQPPLAFVDGPYASQEGSAVTMSAAASVDPNGQVVSYAWSFGDGTSGTGAVVAHTYAQDGVYTVHLVVTDNDGLTDELDTTVTVANVAPVLGPVAGATLLPGESFTAAGTFADPGADAWTATVDWGDGSTPSTAALADRSFALAHTYAAAGTFTVTVQIADDHTAVSTTTTVIVQTQSQGVTAAIALVDGLVAAGKLDRVIGLVLDTTLGLAKRELDRGHPAVAKLFLRAALAEIDALTQAGVVAADDVAPLRALVARILAAT